MKKLVALTLCIILLFTICSFANDIQITVDGETKVPAVAPVIINGNTMVPVRFIAELFGCEVSWDANTQTVVIISKEAIELRNKITLAEFDTIQVGMTYEQVVNIIGGPGEKTYEYDFGESEYLSYRYSRIYNWEGTGDYGYASITFHDNIVESKNQFGLE